MGHESFVKYLVRLPRFCLLQVAKGGNLAKSNDCSKPNTHLHESQLSICSLELPRDVVHLDCGVLVAALVDQVEVSHVVDITLELDPLSVND